MHIPYHARTDVGKTRDHNEDDYGYGEGPLGDLLVVCDGMGGHASGEVASHLAVETIVDAYYSAGGADRGQALEEAFVRANELIYIEGRGTMGTTGVAALFVGDAAVVANVGDSRAYLIRHGAPQQITRDHSLVGDQIAAGLITTEQSRSLYYRNVITRALGYQLEVAVDVFMVPVQLGDRLVLCSDGLHGLVEDAEIATIAAAAPLEQAVDTLIDLANERGGTDNITVLIAEVAGLDTAARASEIGAASDDLGGAPDERPTRLLRVDDPAPAIGPATALVSRDATPPAKRLAAPGAIIALMMMVVLLGAIWWMLPGIIAR